MDRADAVPRIRAKPHGPRETEGGGSMDRQKTPEEAMAEAQKAVEDLVREIRSKHHNRMIRKGRDSVLHPLRIYH